MVPLTVNKNDQLILGVLIQRNPLTLNLFEDTVQSFCYHTVETCRFSWDAKRCLQRDIYSCLLTK